MTQMHVHTHTRTHIVAPLRVKRIALRYYLNSICLVLESDDDYIYLKVNGRLIEYSECCRRRRECLINLITQPRGYFLFDKC